LSCLYHEDIVCAQFLESVLALTRCDCSRKTWLSLLLSERLSTFHIRMMQRYSVTNVHERAGSPVRSFSSDTTRLSDDEAQPDQAICHGSARLLA
jgi:hypothetical protein